MHDDVMCATRSLRNAYEINQRPENIANAEVLKL